MVDVGSGLGVVAGGKRIGASVAGGAIVGTVLFDGGMVAGATEITGVVPMGVGTPETFGTSLPPTVPVPDGPHPTTTAAASRTGA